MSSVPFPVEFRAPDAGDVGFVVSGWLESYHAGNAAMRAVRFGRYKPAMRRLIHEILERATCIVACDPDHPTHLYGFIVGEREGDLALVHYAYVAQLRRHVGLLGALSAELLRQLGAEKWHEATHLTYVGGRITEKHGIAFNPFPALVRAA